jgi:hypothetical protein
MRSDQRGPKYSETKYWGSYRAIVMDNKHPKMLGYLILQVPEIFGTDLRTDWAPPKNGWLSALDDPAGAEAVEDGRTSFRKSPAPGGDKGDFEIPDIGDGVWVEFEAGDACRPLWSGRWWAEPGGKAEPPKLAREIKDETQTTDRTTTMKMKVPDPNYGGGYSERDQMAYPKETDAFITGRLVGLGDAEWPELAPQEPAWGDWPDRPMMATAKEQVIEPMIMYNTEYPLNRVTKTKRGIVFEIEDTYD